MPSQATLRRLLLQVPNRRRVYEAIVATAGTHVRRMSRELRMALGVVEHHVRQLESHGLVFSHQTGRRRTYYATGQVQSDDAGLVHALRKPVWGDVAAALLAREQGVAALARRLGLPPTTASYHLRRMRDAGLLENLRVGRESVYLVREPERVRRVLSTLRPQHARGPGGLAGVVARAVQHDGRPAAHDARTGLLTHAD